jgi:hypothetical protein
MRLCCGPFIDSRRMIAQLEIAALPGTDIFLQYGLMVFHYGHS